MHGWTGKGETTVGAAAPESVFFFVDLSKKGPFCPFYPRYSAAFALHPPLALLSLFPPLSSHCIAHPSVVTSIHFTEEKRGTDIERHTLLPLLPFQMATKDNARRWTADTFLPKPTNPASSLHASNSFNGLGSGGGPGGAHSSLDVIRELDDKEHSDLAFLDPRNGHHTLIDSNSSSSSGSSSGSNNSSSDDNDDDDDDEEHEGEEEEEGEEEDEDGDCSDNEHEQQSADDDDMEEVDMEDHSQAQEDNSHGTNESSLASSSTDASATTNSGNSKKSKRRESISAAGGTSSTTPARKFTKKVKKVKTKSSKGSKAISDEAKLEAAKPVVDRFLELENPDINGKPVFLFMIPGNKITRP